MMYTLKMRSNYAMGALRGPRRHARRPPRGRDDARGQERIARGARARRRASDHNGELSKTLQNARAALRAREAPRGGT